MSICRSLLIMHSSSHHKLFLITLLIVSFLKSGRKCVDSYVLMDSNPRWMHSQIDRTVSRVCSNTRPRNHATQATVPAGRLFPLHQSSHDKDHPESHEDFERSSDSPAFGHHPTDYTSDTIPASNITASSLSRKSVHDNNSTMKRKKKNVITSTSTSFSSTSSVSDNRDNLPFVVKVITPDPYTNQEQLKQRARSNTKLDKQKHADRETSSTSSITSSIFMQTKDGSLQPILGEFFLDKSTNCGDFIHVDGREYIVQKARSQYKYVGGKKFVLARKVLEVKETLREVLEQRIRESFQAVPSVSSSPSSVVSIDDTKSLE